MATKLALDDKLIDEARRIGGHATKKEAVTAALDEYIRRRKQAEILQHFGSVDFDPQYQYKKLRRSAPEAEVTSDDGLSALSLPTRL